MATMKTKQSPPLEPVRKKEAASEFARGVRFLVNLRDSLEQSRTHGITLVEAKRQFAKRLSAEEPPLLPWRRCRWLVPISRLSF